MKFLIFVIIISSLLAACKQHDNAKALQSRVDGLERQLADSYKPGLGEFMSSIQVHHAKLWFAGQNQNWKLADFEIHEMMEALDDIQKYVTDRKESKLVSMLNPALDSINHAIQQENLPLFNTSFNLLTNSCNSCHRSVNFEFNVVKIPDTPPYSNQDFKLNEQK